MTLKSLRDLPPSEASRVLARLALHLLPSATTDAGWYERLSSDTESSNVVEELRQFLRLRPNDHSDRARERMMDRLISLMTQTSLSADQLVAVGKRVGESGDLPLSYYEIKFSDSFEHGEAQRGIRRRFVEEAIRQPDKMEWFPPKDEGGKAIALFMKLQPPQNNSIRWLLVHASVSGQKLDVVTCWWIWPGDVGMEEKDQPLVVLRKLVDKYGVPFSVGPRVFRTLVFDESFPMEGFRPQGNIFGVHPPRRDMKVEGNADRTRVSPLGIIEVGLAYAIDVSGYEQTLRERSA
jgi:hypothetical protein